MLPQLQQQQPQLQQQLPQLQQQQHQLQQQRPLRQAFEAFVVTINGVAYQKAGLKQA